MSTGHVTVYSTFISARHVLGCIVCSLKTMMYNSLDQLATASSLTDTLKELHRKGCACFMKTSTRLKTNALPPQESPAVTLRNSDQDATQRIPVTSWAEEIDILDPILDERPGNEARIMEVSPRTRVCITASFCSMANSARRTL